MRPRLRAPRSQLRRLTPIERLALRLGRIVNESPDVKPLTQAWNELFTAGWMGALSSGRTTLVGIEEMRALRPDRGVLIAANHRSFFDQFIVATHLARHVSWCRRLFFPVRSGFFYDNPLGVIVNAAMSSMTMFPPIFRESEKRDVTRAGLDFLAAELARPGTVVGIHPEGTRGKGPDPYELLPAEAGFGRVVLLAKPIVVPVFVNGLGNDFVRECLHSIQGRAQPIVIAFGRPVELGELLEGDPQRLRSQVAVGRKVLDAIRALGEVERGVRATLTQDAAATATNRPS